MRVNLEKKNQDCLKKLYVKFKLKFEFFFTLNIYQRGRISINFYKMSFGKNIPKYLSYSFTIFLSKLFKLRQC